MFNANICRAYRFGDVLAGDLDVVVDALLEDERTRQLAALDT